MKNKKILILIIIIIIIISYAINTGIKIYNWQTIVKDMINNSPSKILDNDGNIIAEIGNNKNIDNVPITSIPKNLKNAYISIEDQRFYSHHGIDIKRTSYAIFSYIKHLGSSSFGGSTLTQQLVKNLTGDNTSKISRKFQEWIRAISLEKVLSKEEILEAYLNIIYVGPNIYGVSLGSNYYFDKDVSKLSLAECAFLAGINNSPNSYNPFNKDVNNTEKINNRTKTVLYKMNELGYIGSEEYSDACAEVDNGLNFKNGKLKNSTKSKIYSYHSDALISQIISELSTKKNISKEFANNYLEMAGLNIYSTQNSNIQSIIEKEFINKKYILKSSNDSETTSQAAMIVINNNTGYVVRMCTVV